MDSPTSSEDARTGTSLEEDGETTEEAIYSPYYLENFKWICDTVCGDAEFQPLFSADNGLSQQTFAVFNRLETDAQKLYVRLILRKHVHLKRSRIKYEEELGGYERVSSLLDVLCNACLLEDRLLNVPLSETLRMLGTPQLRELAKAFRIDNVGCTKEEVVQQFAKRCREQRTPFGAPLSCIIARRASESLGKIYRVEDARRRIFLRAMNLFQLTAGITTLVGQSPIFALLQINIGKLRFPEYTVKSERALFASCERFASFEAGQNVLESIFTAFESRDFEGGKIIYLRALPVWERIVENPIRSEEVSILPLYLRKFTAGYQYTKVMEKGLEILEKLDEKSDAINGYMQILDQTLYVPHHRGGWYNRLTILMWRIDKRPEAALKMLERGVKDAALRDYQRLELYERLQRVYKQIKCKKVRRRTNLLQLEMKYTKAPIVTIPGRLCPTERMGKGKTVFLGKENGTLVCSVEELALAHFRQEGYSEGIHAEGSTFTTIYGLLFWPVIYLDGIADVFRSKFQAAPLDLGCPSFYVSRETAIQSRCDLISSSSIEELCSMVSDIWNSHQGIQTPVVNWDIFASLETLLILLSCFHPRQLASICERFAKNFGGVRAGFPDLTLWNPDEKKVKIVEVKGPNDRLSYKQILWMDFLMEIGICVEVCHVVSTGSKRKSLDCL